MRLKHNTIVLLIITLLFVPGQSALFAANTNQKITAVETSLLPEIIYKNKPIPFMTIQERMEHYKVPGLSIAVINEGRIEWAKGYGVREAGKDTPVTPETRFQAASISKPVSTMAALYFVQNGLLDLDEDVNNKLKSWHVPENEFTQTEKVTLRRLLSHTAGLTVHGFRGYAQDEVTPNVIQVLNGEKPANSAPIQADIIPGTQWRYSGGGFTVSQQLLMDISGKTFPALLHETILSPLDMSRSTFAFQKPGTPSSNIASAHIANGKRISGLWHNYPEMAAAGLWTTPTDLAKFAIEIQNVYNGKSNRVIGKDMVDLMLTPQLSGYGLGLSVEGEGKTALFRHGGENKGYLSHLYAFINKGQGAVVMINSDYGSGIFNEIYRGISHVYGWPTYKPERLGESRQITFHVTAKNIPKDSTIYITGNHAQLANWNPGKVALQENEDGTWSGTFSIEENKNLRYKITLGSWDTEAVQKDGTVPQDSILQVKDDTTVKITVENWKDLVE